MINVVIVSGFIPANVDFEARVWRRWQGLCWQEMPLKRPWTPRVTYSQRAEVTDSFVMWQMMMMTMMILTTFGPDFDQSWFSECGRQLKWSI